MSYNIFDICVSDTDLTEGLIEEVINIIEDYSEEYHPWEDAHSYMSLSEEDTFTYIERYGNGNFSLEGGLQGQRTLVDAKTWVKTLKEHIGILNKEPEDNTKIKYNLHEIYFKTKEATQEQLEDLFNLASQESSLSVDHFVCQARHCDCHVSFWEAGGYLNGLSDESAIVVYISNPVKVSPDVFVNVVREFYTEEEEKVEDIKLEEMETIGTVTPGLDLTLNMTVHVPAEPHTIPVTIRKFTEEPRPRFRKRRQRPVKGKKPVVRIIYTDQSTYCFKNVKQVQVYDNKVYIAYQRQVEDGIVENSEAEIDGSLVMGVVIQKDLDNAQIFHNIDKTWDFFDEHGTAIRGAFNITKTIN